MSKSDVSNGMFGGGRLAIVHRMLMVVAILVMGGISARLLAEDPQATAATESKEAQPTPATPTPEKKAEAAPDQETPAETRPATTEKVATPARKPAPVKRKASAPEDELTASERDVLNRMNSERGRYGRRPLRINRHLMKAARRHAANMARWNTMSHNLGGNVAQRVSATGVWMRSSGENIAQGQRSGSQVMNTWMASSGHRNNILSTGYTDVGIAVAYSTSGTPYWVQVFATP